MPVQCTCRVCGSAFLVRPCRADVALFCSRACKGVSQKNIPATILLSEDGQTARVPLHAHDRKTVRAYVVIDASDAVWASQWRWMLDGQGYAVRIEKLANPGSMGQRTRRFLMHRELLGLTREDDREGDHINHDRLDNRRMNLRAIPKYGNRQNLSARLDSTSILRGVSWDTLTRKWRARVRVNGRTMHLGLFETEAEAGAVAKAARLRYMPYAVD